MPGLNCYCAETVVPLGRPVGSQLDSRKDNKGKKKKKEKVKEIQFPTGGMCSFTELLSSRRAAALQQLHSIVNITQEGIAREQTQEDTWASTAQDVNDAGAEAF